MRMGFREKHQRSTATFQQQDIIVRSYESTYDTVREGIDPTVWDRDMHRSKVNSIPKDSRRADRPKI